MRLPRSRFTVRRMMIAVAVVAGLVAGATSLERRRQRFEAIATYHAEWERTAEARRFAPGQRGPKTPRDGHRQSLLAARHLNLAVKYFDAARSPWLPVAPDPPEPK